MVWVNKRERTNRRKLQQLDLTAATDAINARAAAITHALAIITRSAEGAAHVARLGWTPPAVDYSLRSALNGTVQGTLLLQSVVLARWVDRLLNDVHFTQWAADTAPDALAGLRAGLDARITGFDPATGSIPGCFTADCRPHHS
jgi:hypothetical protein